MQSFDNRPCARRTPLGACAEQGVPADSAAGVAPGTRPEEAKPRLLAMPEEEESDLVRTLKQRSLENKEKNDREVLEKTLKAGMGGSFGPFANVAPVMRADGSFETVPLAKLDRLRDKGYVVTSATGLDTYAKGYDPDHPPPEKTGGGFFGLF